MFKKTELKKVIEKPTFKPLPIYMNITKIDSGGLVFVDFSENLKPINLTALHQGVIGYEGRLL
jgi:hypothetical protein